MQKEYIKKEHFTIVTDFLNAYTKREIVGKAIFDTKVSINFPLNKLGKYHGDLLKTLNKLKEEILKR